MRYETLSDMMRKRAEAKASGNKREPLYTLKDCCEAAGVAPQVFGRWAAQFPGAPKPVQGVYHNQRMPYYRKREVVQWIAQVKEKLSIQKGTVMTSSLKEALEQALEKARSTPAPIPADWDDEGGAATITETSTSKEKPMKHLFQTTNNVSRETFNYVRDNPGATRVQAMEALSVKGFKPSSVSSLLSQMHVRGMLRGDALSGYYATIPEYQPIKSAPRRKKVVTPLAKPPVKRKVEKREAPAGLQTLAEKKAALLGSAPKVEGWTPDAVLHGLSVIQAKAVYDELKKLFH